METGNAFGNGSIERVDPRTIGKASGTAAGAAAEPAAGGPGGTAGPAAAAGIDAPKRRGRPKGSKNKARSESGTANKAAVPVDANAISAILLSIHAMLAGMTKTPELAIEKNEADAIADATAKVAELYDMTAQPRVIAWTNLAMACGMVYGTRFVAIRERKKTERENRRKKVVSINPHGGINGPTLPGWNTDPIGPDGKPTKQ